MRILFLVNHSFVIDFRKELVEALIQSGDEIYIDCPREEQPIYYKEIGCHMIDSPIDRRSTNPAKDIKLLFHYYKIFKKVNPDLILTYTIKPNIYGGIVARITQHQYIHTVAGLGSVFLRDMWMKKFVIWLSKFSFKKSKAVYFLNSDNEQFYHGLGIVDKKTKTIVVPGSGVNIEKFDFCKLEDKPDEFVMVARVLKDKGVSEFIQAARSIKAKYPNTKFHMAGPFDDESLRPEVKMAISESIIVYHGRLNDVKPLMGQATCVVLPSYGEGCGTVLQEGAALGRPLITCDTYGCRDNVIDGYNGFLCEVKDAESLANAMCKYINLTSDQKILMGYNSRKLAQKYFDRNIVIRAYLDVVRK